MNISRISRDQAKEIVRKTWVKQVHVDEEGYFSTCDDDCGECCWYDYFDVHSTPLMQYIESMCRTFPVKTHETGRKRGMTYTYFEPTAEAIDFLIDNAMPEIEEAANMQ